MGKKASAKQISVIVPESPFVRLELRDVDYCLAALNVEELMRWWPGRPHQPNRDPEKIREIQRSLDWKRVAQIAAYLLQDEIIDAPAKLNKYFSDIYEPKKLEPGREWPPKIPKIIGFERSEYPTFSNILVHVNGARILKKSSSAGKYANLFFDEADKNLNFSVIDGQHRINGAYLALKIRQESDKNAILEIPAGIFLALDKVGAPPRLQAQIFIDVNYYQKKVDRSLVADLFPTTRGKRDSIDDTERAQDIGRRLMLEVGPLVGMVQIPGIKFGVKDVVTLATLNSAIEDIIEPLTDAGLVGLEEQTEFLAQCLDSWLEATGRKHNIVDSEELDPSNVSYQGRVLVSFLTLLPACIFVLKKEKIMLISDAAKKQLAKWLSGLMQRAGLLKDGKFIAKERFKKDGYLGSGGTGRFRDKLWAASVGTKEVWRLSDKEQNKLAEANKVKIYTNLAKS